MVGINGEELEIVFRVEHSRERCGPYRVPYGAPDNARDFALELNEIHRDGEHPNPIFDFTVRGVFRPFMGRFGFTSLDALVKWFSPDILENLRQCGYVVAVYTGTVSWEGETGQCTFYCNPPTDRP